MTMSSKREILEEMSEEKLREMARDRDLEVKSIDEKSELIDIIEENYNKGEIDSWTNLGIEMIESNRIEKEKENEEVKIEREESFEERSVEISEKENRNISSEDVEVEERELVQRDPVFITAVFGAAIAIVIAILFLFFGM